jgi:osmoprotectant transport system permease protein
LSSELDEQLALLPERLAQHIGLTLVALAVGIAVSFPLALLVVRHPRLRWPALTVAGIIQTIPGLALLALMVPALDLLRRHVFHGLPAFGFWPAVVALVLYSVLPVLRNTVTGILGVDASLLEAARGLGLTPRQTLWQVQLPLAAPVILAGIRTAVVWTVGVATLSTPVGQPSLGNYIFSGLQTRNWVAVTVGCVGAAALAVFLDGAVALLESAVARRSRARAIGAAAAMLAVLAVGVWPLVPGGGASAPVRIGAKTFTEQYVLAEVLGGAARDAGFEVEQVESLGSTIAFDALAGGDIDAYVDYTGTIWANHMHRTDVADADLVLAEVTRWLAVEHDVMCLGRVGFENAYALAMRRDRAVAMSVRTIAELAPRMPGLALGSDYEFFGRPEWKRLRDIYGLAPKEQVSFDSTFMYDAVKKGEVDVITAFSSDGRIAAYDLVVLDDPKRALPPYDAVILVGPRARQHPGLTEALRSLVGTIDVGSMRRANELVDLDGKSRAEAAAWLREARARRPSPG